MEPRYTSIKQFMRHHYRHFNAAATVDAAQGWVDHLQAGGKMLLTMGGAMSTAEMGLSVAELIRQDKVHALCVTGANLEEDIFNLVAHNSYERLPNYRSLTAPEETALHERGMNRVTDTCIPEEEAIRKIEGIMLQLWQEAEKAGERLFPHQFLYRAIERKLLQHTYQIDAKDSWLIAAQAKNLPIFTPGWEDSTLGNIFVSHTLSGEIKRIDTVKSGTEQMAALVGWYLDLQQRASIGFFQIAGGIAGDFPICVVPLIRQDLQKPCQLWGYFCQISDSTTSFGSYSGAVPNEKITWGKLAEDTPKFIIESDATLVFPLIAQYVLEST